MSLFILFFFLTIVSVTILAVIYCAHVLKQKRNFTPRETDLDVLASISSTTPGKTSTVVNAVMHVNYRMHHELMNLF